MISISSSRNQVTSPQRWAFLAILGVIASFLAGCAPTTNQAYHTTAYQPASMGDIAVKVSLKEQVVYVMEGSTCLMATPTCVGKPGFVTPTGNFKVTLKDQTRRSATYGYWVNGTDARPGKASQSPGPGYTYVGYPLAFWVEFAPGFGFHEGPIWPYPRSHGCLHIHDTASAKFFELVQVGTPVNIAQTQPEDATIGKTVKRPTDYADPDPAPQLMISDQFFKNPRENQLTPITPAGTPPPQA